MVDIIDVVRATEMFRKRTVETKTIFTHVAALKLAELDAKLVFDEILIDSYYALGDSALLLRKTSRGSDVSVKVIGYSRSPGTNDNDHIWICESVCRTALLDYDVVQESLIRQGCKLIGERKVEKIRRLMLLNGDVEIHIDAIKDNPETMEVLVPLRVPTLAEIEMTNEYTKQELDEICAGVARLKNTLQILGIRDSDIITEYDSYAKMPQ
jgi:hypothetical protein